MVKRGQSVILVWILIFAIMAILGGISAANDVPRITKEELKPMLGNPDMILVDVRTASSWDESDSKIQGAVREDPKKVSSWADKYPKDKTFVFYCS